MKRLLLRPFDYLRIEHAEKWKVDWLYPTLLSVLSTFFLYIFNGLIDVSKPGQLLPNMFGVVSVLPGFYIAALAAISTFNKQNIDEVMPEPSPMIDMEIGGHSYQIPLTRRRFLAMLFAFLCAESLLLSISLAACQSVMPGAAVMFSRLGAPVYFVLKVIFVWTLLTLFWQLIVATFFGLYYLGDRLLAANVSKPIVDQNSRVDRKSE